VGKLIKMALRFVGFAFAPLMLFIPLIAVDLTGWVFSDDDSEYDWCIPEGVAHLWRAFK